MRAPDWSGPSEKAMSTGIFLLDTFSNVRFLHANPAFVAQKQMTYSKGGQRCLKYSEGRYVLKLFALIRLGLV